MKIRTIKLREAHKNGAKSICSVLWDQKGEHIITASSSDPSIWIHDVQFPSVNPKSIKHHREGVTALVLSPNSTCLASGSIDHSVKLYKFPGGEFETNITRFTLPIRALAFNKSGTMLAAAGDDEGIKLINTIDGSIARVFKGHKGAITGLAFDPKSEYFASVDSTGTVIHWELQPGTILHTLKGVAPATFSDQSTMNVLNWNPEGDLLAVPGLKNDVVLYDRDTAEKLFSLRGDHVQPVCFLSWSPNGKYMATSGLDKQILIWDVEKKQDLDRQKFSERVSCMAWKPKGNALAVIDVMGKYGVWESPVPSSMKSPTEDIPSVGSNGLLFFDEDGEPSASGSLSDAAEDSNDEAETLNRKRLCKKSSFSDSWEDDMNDDLILAPKVESQKMISTDKKHSVDHRKDESKGKVLYSQTKMQEPFQPGATPVQPGKRRFLCYNMLGCISIMDNGDSSHIEFDFHDTGSGPRVKAITDYFGCTMASLNEKGYVLANPCKGEKNMSTLMYNPINCWATNSEWSMRFEEEEVKAVALGSSWVAAATNLNFLRIFTEGGLQRHILSLDGPVVTLVGSEDKLAVVTHSSPSLPSNEQMLEFRLLNVSSATQLFRGHLPLTPGSCLSWFGFGEEGQLGSFDSKGVLRVFTNQYGGSWFPFFSKLKKSDENYWIVGFNAAKVFCVACKSPSSFPQVTPKPLLTLLDHSFPIAGSNLAGAERLENEFILNNMHLIQIQEKIEEAATIGQDTGSLDDEAFNKEVAFDRCALKLIGSCCTGNMLLRATELVKLLYMEKSVRGAVKLATDLKLPSLAERFNTILEERIMNEARGSTILYHNPKSEILTLPAFDTVPMPSYAESSKPKVETVSPSPRERSPLPSLKRKVKEEGQLPMSGKGKEMIQTGKTEKPVELKSPGELKNIRERMTLLKKVPEESPVVSIRPTNPFAKKSITQESSSLFSSLKKTKTEK